MSLNLLYFTKPIVLGLLIISCAWITEPAFAGSVYFSVSGHQYHTTVKSLKDQKFTSVLQQKYDYSCGSAALATLLKYHYEHDIDALDIFKSMYESGNKQEINRYGFSLLDMKQYLQRQGYQSEGFRISLDQYLKLASVPAIVLIQTDGYKHFVVLKGVRQEHILIGDPAKGLKRMKIPEFEKIWAGLFFIITNKAETGKRNFNRSDDWEQLINAPLEEATPRSTLGQFSLSLPHHSDFF